MEESVVNRFRMKRTEKGLSIRAMAKLCGVSSTTLFYWEEGRSFPDPKRWARVGAAYGLGKSWLEDHATAWHVARVRRAIRWRVRIADKGEKCTTKKRER